MTQDLWGFSVRPNMVSCAWTKLLLDGQSQITKHDDLELRNPLETGSLRLPRGRVNKNAPEVCQDFLHEMYKHLLDRISAQIGESFLKATPMDCCLTVPAVWSDRAQDLTRAAAKAAGFGSRPGDHIYVISEPEAAAIATLKRYMMPHAPNPPKVRPFHTVL